MNIVDKSQSVLLSVGASPILYLMIGLSVVSIAVMLERGWFFFSIREDLKRLAMNLTDCLARGDADGARAAVETSRSAEAAIAAAGLRVLDQGVGATEEAMASATVIERMRLERGLAFLGTLGNNAPFVGLLGTVIGIVQAFAHLKTAGIASSGASTEVMGAIAEALVATAIGLAVAIPAVAGFNYFQRKIKSTLGNAEALTHVLLGYQKARESGAEAAAPKEQPSTTLDLSSASLTLAPSFADPMPPSSKQRTTLVPN